MRRQIKEPQIKYSKKRFLAGMDDMLPRKHPAKPIVR